MTSLASTLDHWTLSLAAAIGGLTAFVLLDVARRFRLAERSAGLWWFGGSVACGTGLWAAHFIGMTAHVMPFAVTYSGKTLIAGWACAVCASGFVLATARRSGRGIVPVATDALVLALLLAGLHHANTDAAVFAPEATWDAAVGSLALVVGFVASILWSGAVRLFGTVRAFRDATSWQGFAAQSGMSALPIVALVGAFELAMHATRLPLGATCVTVAGFDGGYLHDMVAVVAPLVLGFTLLGSISHALVDGRRAALAGSLESVAARLQSANDELNQRAMLDPLTGLPNRTLFEDRLGQALLRADRARKSVRGLREKLAILFIDVDGFKAVNDSFGHATGDDVIRELAERLRIAARNEDTVARIGSDQFLVLTEGGTSGNDCVALAMRILESTKKPLAIGNRTVQISVSIGVVVYPDHGERSRLLAQADAAMQAAKRAGRGTYALFESHMHADMANQLALINDLRQAIDRGQLALHYQPKIDGRRHVICGVEALLRWHHPVRGPVGPAEFIPLAERFGLINLLGNWVIETACAQIAAWAKDRVHMRVAINLSVHQLREPDLVARIQSALDRHRIKSSQLLCEITESVAMQDIAATQRTLDDLGKIGVYLAIDDFGTGYSSLSYLRQLPARQLKIDRTFIHDLDGSDDAKAVVDGVVRLAHALGLRVVAEGVETASQRDILLGLNCDELQGYFFARPMSADKLLAWTLGHKPKGTVDFAASLVHRAVEA